MTRLSALLICLALALGVSACTENDPEPRFADPTSDAPSTEPSEPTSSASPSPTVDPDETAEEFIRRFQAEEFKMQNTGESDTYRALIRDSCVPCVGIADRVDQFYRNGGFIKAEAHEVEQLRIAAQTPRGTLVEYQLRSGTTKYRERSGAEVVELSGGSNRYQVLVKQVQGSWRVISSVQV